MEMNTVQPHIRCGAADAAPYALLPGDPGRVDRVREFLTDVRDIASNREYRSISGAYRGVRVMAVSTGIGGASTAIAVEELHNIGVRAMIRIGSCGALRDTVRLGDLVLLSGVVRDDGASAAYIDRGFPAAPDPSLLLYTIEAARANGFPCHVGLGRSHDSFYTDREEAVCSYWGQRGVLGADMESAALFVVGALRGVRTASILNNVVACGADAGEGVGSYVDGETLTARGERAEILTALEALARLGREGTVDGKPE